MSSRLSQDLSQSQELTVTAATSGFSQSASKAVAADQLITASIDFSGLDEQYKGTENREKVRKLDIKQFISSLLQHSRIASSFTEKLRSLALDIERMQPNLKVSPARNQNFCNRDRHRL